MPSPLKRRDFLRLVGSVAALTQVPSTAWAASRPPLEMVFPQDPTITWYDATYGLTKPDGRRHLGIDLMAPKLTPVYSIAEGTVTRIAKSPRAGRYLIIEHSDGWQSWYLHLNNDARRDDGRADWAMTVVDGVEEGSRVEAGTQVAYVGDSGNAEGAQSHTHFELHLGTRTVNPFPYLLDSQAAALAAIDQARVERAVEELCSNSGAEIGADSQVCWDYYTFIPEEPLSLGDV